MRGPTGLLWCAGLLGLLNAAPSWYWAFGGEALLESIGQWLIELRADMPALTSLALLGIALGKTLAAVIPLVAARLLMSQVPRAQGESFGLQAPRRGGRGRGGRGRRGLGRALWNLSRLVAAGLIIYGAAGLVINAGLLLWPGLELQDPAARRGQALLWYPMLMIWGLVLAGGLRRLRVGLAA